MACPPEDSLIMDDTLKKQDLHAPWSVDRSFTPSGSNDPAICRTITALYVEDNPDAVDILRSYLSTLTSHEISLDTCPDLRSARERLANQVYDIIFLDYRVGHEDSFPLLQEILDRDPLCPVIMITAQGGEQIAVEAMKAGATDYLMKLDLTAERVRQTVLGTLERSALRRQLESQRLDLLRAERQRVMIESLGAACHHLSQPLTGMLGYLELVLGNQGLDQAQRQSFLEKCRQATDQMRDVLQRLQHVREYRTEPYASGGNILDISSGEG
jgi:CheY-like chemotaxis protein